MNGMDCVREDVYFHEDMTSVYPASRLISSNILERVHAIFMDRNSNEISHLPLNSETISLAVQRI